MELAIDSRNSIGAKLNMPNINTTPKGDHTRQAIIEAMKDLISRTGCEAASMAEMAHMCGLSKASIYHHFASKSELVHEIVETTLRPLGAELDKLSSRADIDSAEKLRLAFELFFSFHERDSAGMAVCLREDRAIKPPFRQNFVASRKQIEDSIQKILLEGMNNGEFKHADVSVASKAFLGMTNWSVVWYRSGGRLAPRQVANFFATLLLDGLGSARKVPASVNQHPPEHSRQTISKPAHSRGKRNPIRTHY